jgi:outer membrane cobalamin receptor
MQFGFFKVLVWALVWGVTTQGYSDNLYSDARELEKSIISGGRLHNPDQTGTLVQIYPDEYFGSGQNLADILSNHAGIQTRKFGAMGSFQTLSIRGVPSSRILVAIDGVLINDADGSPVNLESLNLGQFERVDVYKGYVPARFGGNGVGGVINLISPKNHHGANSLSIAAGSHESIEALLLARSQLQHNSDWISILNHRSSANDFEYIDRNGTLYNKTDDQRKNRSNSDYLATGGFHRYRLYALSSWFSLNISHNLESGGVPGSEDNQNPTARFRNSIVSTGLNYESNGSHMDRFSQIAGVHFSVKNSSLFWTHLDLIGFSSQNQGNEISTESQKWQPYYGLIWNPNPVLKTEFHLLGLKQNLHPEKRHPETSHLAWDLERNQLNAAVEATLFATPKLLFKSDFSLIYTRDHSEGGIYYPSFTDTLEEAANNSLHPAGRLALLWNPFANTEIPLSLARYVKTPGVQERFAASPGLLPNPDLKTESGYNFELGIRQRYGRSEASLIAFENLGQDGIYYLHKGNISKPMNLDKTHVKGLEFTLGSEPARFLSYAITHTWQKTEDWSEIPWYSNNQLPDEPEHSTFVKMMLHPIAILELWASLSNHSLRYRDRANTQIIPTQNLYHAGLNLKILKTTEARIHLVNLSGENYQDVHSAFPTPGRQYFFSLQSHF